MFGRKLLPETREKMSRNRIGSKNPFYGRKHSLLSKNRMSGAKIGKICKPETKEKIGQSLRGKTNNSNGGWHNGRQRVGSSINARKQFCIFYTWELKKGNMVHHLDGNTGNNAKENLCLMRQGSSHSRLHHFADRHNLPISLFKIEQKWLTSNSHA